MLTPKAGRKKPKCSDRSYSCGSVCIPLRKKCLKDGKAVNKGERMAKAAKLAKVKPGTKGVKVTKKPAKTPQKGLKAGQIGISRAIDRNDPKAQAKIEARMKAVQKLTEALESGEFRVTSRDTERSRDGKEAALNALGDARNHRVSLLAVKKRNGKFGGFLSYKEGSWSISIQHVGTDVGEKGMGRRLVEQVIAEAARAGKGIDVAPVPSAVGFYRKMGFDGGVGGMEMSAKKVKELYRRIRTETHLR